MKLIFSIIMIFVGVFEVVAQEHKWTWGGKMDPLQERYEVIHYSLDIEILPKIQGINASMEMTFRRIGKLDTLRLNLIDNYQVTKVEVGDEEISFNHHGKVLDMLPPENANSVKIYYRGKPPVAKNPPWSGGFTWEKDQNGNYWVGLSCQHEGAKIFMPCLDHPSSEPSHGVDMYFKVPFPYFVAANGRLLNQGTGLGYNYFHWATAYPVNNYNINFTMGRFFELSKKFSSTSGREIPMKVFVLEENKAKASGLLEVLERSVITQEKYFGPYPFPDDKIAVVETPYLGMEHQTINGYGNNFQYTQVGDVNFDWLLHHELGHEWWGNKISVSDWADFWIHEGICSYGDMLFYLEHGGEEAYHEHVLTAARGIENKQPIALTPNKTSEEAYQGDIYTKGAYIMHSLRFLLGDEMFFPMIKAFAVDSRYTYTNQVNTKDFIDFVENYSGKDLEDFFQIYLYSTDLPKVKINPKGKNRFDIKLTNVDLSLPMEIQTSEGIEKVVLSKEAVRVKSDRPIVVDPNGWYLLDK
ncbi:M1 family metallopeptidase [Echinicola sp. CAU 1574]|uniref:Aminopeptidase N n=1 Tax=Echinicola arenosa TaxID=2774144 RepID=A0ABR9AJI9_9BACT|nr:M1 family metallopeptidase [Echinicola arenosa]MBD8488481.1 M1 family metallopeptidase [Echinicola arenosa]